MAAVSVFMRYLKFWRFKQEGLSATEKIMNVLHLSSEKTWRGGEQQIAYLIEESYKSGVNCHVACRKNTPFEDYCLSARICRTYCLAFCQRIRFLHRQPDQKILPAA
jgi:hypothetical protein